jgi:hypothetical protein
MITELIAFAICVVTRQPLPPSSQHLYLSPCGWRVPRTRAARGDALFWVTNGNCRTAVKHVALARNAHIMLYKLTRLSRARAAHLYAGGWPKDLSSCNQVRWNLSRPAIPLYVCLENPNR